MRCPFCQDEMKSGYMHNGRQPLEWVPADKKPTAFADRYSPDGVPLINDRRFWSGYRAEAFYCPACHIVIAREGHKDL